MKKIFLAIAFIFTSSLAAKADETSEKVLRRVETIVGGYDNYVVRFTVTSDEFYDLSGAFTINRNRYNIVVGGERQFSDGVARYEIHAQDQEIIIDRHNPDDRNLFSNPANAFFLVTDQFRSTYQGSDSVAEGERCHKILLTPADPMQGVSAITVYVGVVSELPRRISYDYDGVGIDIQIDSVEELKAVDDSLYRFNAADYPGYEIIDFR